MAITMNRQAITDRLQGARRDAADITFPALISAVASPPVLLLVAFAWLARFVGQAGAFDWLALYVALGVGLPLLYILFLYRRGLVSDLDVSRREERLRPMLFTLVCMGGAGIVLWLGGAPRLLAAWSAIIWAQLALVMVITLRWKISIHSAAAASLSAMFIAMLGPIALLTTPLVGLVGWSRVRLVRHTPAQTVAGALLGGVVTVGLLWLARG